jgi:hypothetical protein
MFGPEYCKIQTAFKRDERNVIMPGKWTLPEFAYLQDLPWRWTEKVDGTNIRLHWDGENVTIGGRTDSAMIPAHLLVALEPYTLAADWHRIFPDASDVTVYGEGYGPKIQNGGQYRDTPGFIVFDVRIGPWWLQDENVSDVAAKLGMEVVPSFGEHTLNEAWAAITEGKLVSHWRDAKPEGLVGRPAVELFTRKGERLIVKMKTKDWADYLKRK